MCQTVNNKHFLTSSFRWCGCLSSSRRGCEPVSSLDIEGCLVDLRPELNQHGHAVSVTGPLRVVWNQHHIVVSYVLYYFLIFAFLIGLGATA